MKFLSAELFRWHSKSPANFAELQTIVFRILPAGLICANDILDISVWNQITSIRTFSFENSVALHLTLSVVQDPHTGWWLMFNYASTHYHQAV